MIGPPIVEECHMVKNVGTADRVARLFAAGLLAFLAATTYLQGWAEIICYVLAAYFGLTAIFGHCLIYRTLDINSRVHAGTYHSGDDVTL